MSKFEVDIDVPFVENPGKRCVVACGAMAVAHTLPAMDFSFEEVERLCGYREGISTWGSQLLLSLSDMNVGVAWIEDAEIWDFATNPSTYMKKLFSEPEAYAYQMGHSDIPTEARRVRRYLQYDL